jgi:hypothetical protein
MTSGNFVITSGNLTVTSGTLIVTAGDVTVGNGQGQVIGHTAQITFNALIPELQVLGTLVGVDAAAAIALYSSTAGEGPQLVLARSKSATLGTNTIVASGDQLGRILFLGADGSTGFDPAAAIVCEVDGTPGATTDMPGLIRLQVSPDGSQTPATALTVRADTSVEIVEGAPKLTLGTVTAFGTTQPTNTLVFKIGTAPAGTIVTSCAIFTDGTVLKKIIAANTVSNIEA